MPQKTSKTPRIFRFEPVSEDEIERLIKELETTPAEFKEAQRRALQKTAKSIGAYVGKEIARKLALPLRVVASRVRPYKARPTAGGYYKQAIVMYGYAFPEILKGTDPREGGFIGGKGKGKLTERIYRRQGEPRNPLYQDIVEALDAFEEEAVGLTTIVMELFRKKLSSELKYVSGIKRYR
jgi:hypothetical protein